MAREARLSPLQRKYLRHACCRWNVKTGAVRSGKTFVDYACVIPRRVLAARDDGLVVLMGTTRGTLERNVLEPMRRIWSPGLVGEIRGDGTVELFGRRCYALGAEKRSQSAKLQGAGVAYCYGDEVTTWHPQVFDMLKSRLDSADARFDGTCNPAGPGHWFKAFLDSGADLYQQRYTIDDNPFLDTAFVDNLKREYAGTTWYDRFILGRWTRAQGLIYPQFDRERHLLRGGLPARGRWFIAVDYGTLNPFAATLWLLSGGVGYLAEEFYHDGRRAGRQLDDEQYYLELERLAGGRPIEEVVVDPSAASFIACVQRHGRFSVARADNSVLDGIRNTATALNNHWIFVAEGCVNTLREFELYAWDEEAGRDRPLKEDDHAMDSVRYFVRTVLMHERG